MPKEYNFDFRKIEDQEEFEELPKKEKTRLIKKVHAEAIMEDKERDKKVVDKKDIGIKMEGSDYEQWIENKAKEKLSFELDLIVKGINLSGFEKIKCPGKMIGVGYKQKDI